MDDSRALAWDVQTVFGVMKAHPEVCLDAVRLISKEAAALVDHTVDLTASPVERRLARVIHRLARSTGRQTASGILIEMGLSGQDLAGLINATPYTVSRVLAAWHRLKVVAAQRRRLLVFDVERLAAIAAEPGIEIAG